MICVRPVYDRGSWSAQVEASFAEQISANLGGLSKALEGSKVWAIEVYSY